MSSYLGPFIAGFGVNPPDVAGRDAIVHQLLANLRDGPVPSTYVTPVDRPEGTHLTLEALRALVETWLVKVPDETVESP